MDTLIIDKEEVLQVFDDDDRALKVKEIGKALGLGAEHRSSLRAFLRGMVQQGVLIALPGRRFGLAKTGALVEGTVRLHPKGYGWLLSEDDNIKDAFLPPDECVGLMRGDVVSCRIEETDKGPLARVERIVQRGGSVVVGTLRRSGRARYVEPNEDVLRSTVVIEPADATDPFRELPDGAVVEVVIERFPTDVTSALGRIVRFIGHEGDIHVEIERLLTEGGIVRPFSMEASEQAAAFPKAPTAKDSAGREDLRDTALCTIDGADAKDFDDAVYAEDTGKGWKVIVAIADVSHYVQEHSPLDEDAKQRSTSVYLPGQCIPMLPESLSNGLCSLKPKVVRLCMCVEMHLSRRGKLTRARFFEGVMKSKARLTYDEVQTYFEGVDEGAALGESKKIPLAVRHSLHELRAAAQALRKQRFQRGSQDFDMPEPYFKLDDEGLPSEVLLRERKESHRLIEELMIAANEAVAKRFEQRGWPCVYRIHEPPNEEKLERFFELLRYSISDPSQMRAAAHDPRALRRLMEQLDDNEAVADGTRTALNSLLLRAMMQARYSADNIGHFGLGSDHYLHFTSPIRRYPDLLVHRLLRQHLLHPRTKTGVEQADAESEALEARCVWASTQERRAVDVERKVNALYGVWFVKDKVGEEHVGTVSAVTEFGCFVRLDELGVEGLIHISNMPARMRYDEIRMALTAGRGGPNFFLGDQVEIRIAAADTAKRQIDFHYLHHVDEEGEPVPVRTRSKRAPVDDPPFDDDKRRGKGRGRGRGKRDDWTPPKGPKNPGKPERRRPWQRDDASNVDEDQAPISQEFPERRGRGGPDAHAEDDNARKSHYERVLAKLKLQGGRGRTERGRKPDDDAIPHPRRRRDGHRDDAPRKSRDGRGKGPTNGNGNDDDGWEPSNWRYPSSDAKRDKERERDEASRGRPSSKGNGRSKSSKKPSKKKSGSKPKGPRKGR